MVIMVQLQQIISPILPALTKTYRYSYGMDDRCFRADLRPLIWAASYDPEAQDFMRESYERRLRWSAWIADSALCGWLTLFFSRTTVNALLNRGHMHVLSTAQLQVLIGSALSMSDSGPSGGGDGIGSSLGVASAQARVCDIGAGEGGVTARFEPLLRNTGCITVTETDPVMRMRLARRGYSVQTPQEWAAATEERYEVISCLNVLDRCDAPLTLLKDMRLRLAPDGLLLIALVLPFRPFVEHGASRRQPSQHLPITGPIFETQLSSFITDVLQPGGFVVERISRVPYLCQGDLVQDYYQLNDAIVVARAAQRD